MWSVIILLIFYKLLMRSWKILKKLFSLFKIEKFEGDYNNLNDNAIELGKLRLYKNCYLTTFA